MFWRFHIAVSGALIFQRIKAGTAGEVVEPADAAPTQISQANEFGAPRRGFRMLARASRAGFASAAGRPAASWLAVLPDPGPAIGQQLGGAGSVMEATSLCLLALVFAVGDVRPEGPDDHYLPSTPDSTAVAGAVVAEALAGHDASAA